MLSRDGAVAWFSRSDGLERRVMSVSVGEPVSGAGRPLALDATGRSGLVEQEGVAVLLDAGSTGAPRPVVGEPPAGGRDEAAVQAPYTLADVAGGRSVVAAARGGGMWIGRPGGPALAVLASGPGPVHALAVDPTDTLLAAVVGASLQVWPIQLTRAASRIVLTYDNDRDASSDLLGTGRDAAALAALVASTVLRPPLSIGLFGGWGSGKSFVLREVRQRLDELTGEDRSDGLVGRIKVVAFNAWQYAEVNLWASLVDAVLREINPPATARAADTGPGGSAAAAAAEAANWVVAEKAGQLAEAERTLRTVSHPLRRGALIGGGLTLVVGAVAFGVALAADRWATVVAVVSLVSTVLAAVFGAVAEVRRTVAPIGELVAAGREVRGEAVVAAPACRRAAPRCRDPAGQADRAADCPGGRCPTDRAGGESAARGGAAAHVDGDRVPRPARPRDADPGAVRRDRQGRIACPQRPHRRGGHAAGVRACGHPYRRPRPLSPRTGRERA